MAILSQGTQIFFVDSVNQELYELTGATAFNPGGAPADQIETTGLADKARTYKKGLRTPGQASFTVQADPADPVHVKLFELSKDDDAVVKFAIGQSDGTTPPTLTAGDFTLPTTRTWFLFEGYVADLPMDFATNSVVTSSLSIQRSGDGNWIPKA